ncbi:uncharacterized protein LOC100372880 [Saccoglossus kowalevskii]|uniref:Uncharacterized protein LOC100372880 isoform X1 n=1 Tax=Saccoglossus kowalevskii TaxID=10224 RepID=A0ABM0ME87_SACKO|nr:PREDICTED: uncharacterized protein LOC100372880 isoform X1 [Saccoglossus kowalevskii]
MKDLQPVSSRGNHLSFDESKQSIEDRQVFDYGHSSCGAKRPSITDSRDELLSQTNDGQSHSMKKKRRHSDLADEEVLIQLNPSMWYCILCCFPVPAANSQEAARHLNSGKHVGSINNTKKQSIFKPRHSRDSSKERHSTSTSELANEGLSIAEFFSARVRDEGRCEPLPEEFPAAKNVKIPSLMSMNIPPPTKPIQQQNVPVPPPPKKQDAKKKDIEKPLPPFILAAGETGYPFSRFESKNYCTLCKVFIREAEILSDHLESERHAVNLIDHKKDISINAILDPNSLTEGDGKYKTLVELLTSSTRMSVSQRLKQDKIIRKTGQYDLCLVCYEEIPKDTSKNLLIHPEPKHVAMRLCYTKLMSLMSVFKKLVNPNLRSNAFAFVDKLEQVLDDVPCKLCANQSFIINHGKIISDFGRRKKGAYHLLFGSNCKNQEKHVNFATHRRLMKYVKVIIKVTKAARNEDGKTIVQIIKDYEDQVFGDKDGSTVSCDKCDRVIPKAHHHKKPNHHTCIILQEMVIALQSLKTMKCVNEQGMYPTIQSVGNGNDDEDEEYLAIKEDVKKTNPAPSGEEFDDLTQLLERKQDLENALQSLKTMKCVNEQGMYLTIQSTGNGNDVEDADYLAIKKEVKKTNPAPSGEEVDDLTQLLERKQQDLENADCYSLTSMDLNSNEEDESD